MKGLRRNEAPEKAAVFYSLNSVGSAACQCGDGKEKGSQRTKRKEKASFKLTERVAFVRVFFKSPWGLVRFPRVFPEPGRGPENASPIAAFPAA